MTTRSEREKAQKLNEQHQAILSKMLREDDNKYCADCEAKGECCSRGKDRDLPQHPHGHLFAFLGMTLEFIPRRY